MKKIVLLLSLILAAMPAMAAKTIQLGYHGSTTSAQVVAAELITTQMEKKLPGRFKFEGSGGSTMGGEVNIWDALKLGTVDVAMVTAVSMVTYAPQMGLIGLPFLFRDYDHVTKVLDGPIGQELGQTLNSDQVTFFGYLDHGFRHVSNSKRDIKTPADLTGLRIRVLPNPIMEATFKALGAEVVPLAWTAVYGALDDGRIDGQENPLQVFAGNKFDKVQRHMTLTGHSYSVMVVAMNTDTYKSLKPEEVSAFKSVVQEAGNTMRQAAIEKDRKLVEELRKAGVAIVEEFDRSAFVKQVEPLQPEWEQRFGAELLRKIREIH